MSRARMIVVFLIASLALGAVAAAPASAGEWFIGGTKMAAGQTAAVAATASLQKPLFFTSPSVPVLIECQGPGVSFKGVSISAGKISGESIVYLGCVLLAAPSGCALGSSDLLTLAFEGTVTTGSSPEDRVTLKPKGAGKRLYEVEFTGVSCSISGVQAVNGAVTVKLVSGQTESAIQKLEWLGSMENNSLEGAAAKVYLELGPTLMRLASGSKWSFH